ncbi:MAG: hypothetical protein NTV62_01730 [Candidatus Gribaldobacteria bacterium]|nr:hypothetical protein [Candidatus Gribaldobacteria bacterium]
MEENKSIGSSQKNTGMAVVAYILFFIPLLTEAKNDPFVKYHVKQGLVLFIGYVIETIIAGMPFIWFLSSLLGLALFVLFIIGVMNALNGKQEPLPIIGGLAENFKF